MLEEQLTNKGSEYETKKIYLEGFVEDLQNKYNLISVFV